MAKPTSNPTHQELQIGVAVSKYGGAYGTRIAMEGHAYGIPTSWLLGFCEVETGFANIFGHDRKPSGRPSGIPERWMGTKVTKAKYRWYKLGRRFRGNQGVGPYQLTFPGYQDEADKDGGCWNEPVNIATAAKILHGLWVTHGDWEVVAAIWNAGSFNTAGRSYAAKVIKAKDRWHRILHQEGLA